MALTSSLELDQILDSIVERCQMLTGARAAGIFRPEPDSDFLTYVRASGLASEFLHGLRVRLGRGHGGARHAGAGARLDGGHPQRSLHGSLPETRVLVEREGYRGVLSVPIFIKGEPYGGLSVYWWQPHPVSKAEIEVMTALGGQAAIAIDNARLFADERSGRALLTALLEVNKKIGLLAPTDTLLTSVAEEAMRLLDLDNAGFRLLDGEDLVVAGLAGSAPATMLKPRIKVGESLAGRVVAEGTAIIGPLDTLIGMAPEHIAADRALGYTHFMGLPLRFGERIIGALTFARGGPSVAAIRTWPRPSPVRPRWPSSTPGSTGRRRSRPSACAPSPRWGAPSCPPSTPGASSTSSPPRSARPSGSPPPPCTCTTRTSACSASPVTRESRRFSRDPRSSSWARGLRPRLPRASAVWTPDIISDEQIRLRPDTRERVLSFGQRAALALPLMRDEPFGTIAVYHETGHRFTQAEVEYLSTVASQLVVALDNARLFEAAEVRERRLRSLARLNQLVSSSLDTDEVLGASPAPPPLSWGARGVGVGCRCRRGNAAGAGILGRDHRSGLSLRVINFGQGAMGWVARAREALSVNDMLGDERVLAESWWLEHGLRSFLGVPIQLQDQLLGVLSLCGRAPFTFGADEKELLESFVAQAAVAIRNAGLYAQTAQRLEQTRALLGVAEILNTTLEPRRMLKEVAQRIAQVCHVDRCSLERWEGDRALPLMSQFADGHRQPELWAAFEGMVDDVPREVPIHAQAIETRQPVIVPDASETDLIPRAWIETFHIKSYMVVPLIRGDEVIGVMTLDYTERVTPFEPWQRDLGMAIGNQLALALENQRLYRLVQERLQEATTLLAVSGALSEPEGGGEALRRVARRWAAPSAPTWSGSTRCLPTSGCSCPPRAGTCPRS